MTFAFTPSYPYTQTIIIVVHTVTYVFIEVPHGDCILGDEEDWREFSVAKSASFTEEQQNYKGIEVLQINNFTG